METATSKSETKTTTWNLDTAHSNIRFTIKHMVISKVAGHFKTFSGTVTTEGDNFTTAKVHFEADIDSIDTNKPDRDAHLKSDDFFNAEQFPKMTFDSTKVTEEGEGHYKVEGNLTIRDITKPVALTVESGGVVKDPWGLERAGFHIAGKINRFDYNLKWNALIETGGAVVGDTVNLDIDAEIVKA